MTVFLFVFIFIVLYKVRLSSYFQDYVTLCNTTSIKGIFAIVILYSHLRGYITLWNSWLDSYFVSFINWLGQLMVALYLFYSGFGIMESIRNKPNYRDSFLKNRFLKTLVHFDIAVIIYVLLQYFIGTTFTISHYLQSFIGWESVGNSNWFIFVILALYLMVYLGMWLTTGKQNDLPLCIMTTIGSLFVWIIMYISHHNMNWWYDTILTFPLGFWYSHYRKTIDNFLNNIARYWGSFLIFGIVFVLWKHYYGIDQFGICACLFSILVVLCSMKIRFQNVILNWFGVYAFHIFIMQRLPMILLTHLGINENKYLFVLITIVSLLFIIPMFDKLIKVVDSMILKY